MAKDRKKTGAATTIQVGNGPAVDLDDAAKAILQARAERAAQAKTDAAGRLVSNLRQLILDRLAWEQDKRPWNQRSESEQRATATAVEESVQIEIVAAVETIAAAGQPAIVTTLESLTVKDGVKAVLTLSKHDPAMMHLINAVGGRIIIVVSDAEKFNAGTEPVKITPDQIDIEHVLAESSSDAADHAAEIEDEEAVSPRWNGPRDFTYDSPLN